MESDQDKKTTELYSLAKTAYENAERRFDDADVKTSRYMSVLFIVLGVLTVSVDRFRSIFEIESGWNFAFSLFATFFYMSGITSLVYFILALRIQTVTTLKLDNSLADYMGKYTYNDAVYGLGQAFLRSADRFQKRTKEKLTLARRGFSFMAISLVLAVLAAVSYFFVEFPEDQTVSIVEQRNGESGNGDESSTPESEPVSESDQAAQDAETLFEEFQKGVESGETPKDE